MGATTFVERKPASHDATGNGAVNTESQSRQLSDIIASYDWDFKTAHALAKAESGLNPKNHSWCDRMKDGRAFSVGLFQINLTSHSINGVDCYKAFKGRNKHAKVIDESLYQTCVKMAENAEINVKEAYNIYKRGGFQKWGAYSNGSYLKHIDN